MGFTGCAHMGIRNPGLRGDERTFEPLNYETNNNKMTENAIVKQPLCNQHNRLHFGIIILKKRKNYILKYCNVTVHFKQVTFLSEKKQW